MALVGCERGGAVVRRGQPADQGARLRLAERVHRHQPPRVADRGQEVTGPRGVVGEALDDVLERLPMGVACEVDPLVLELGQELAAAKGLRLLLFFATWWSGWRSRQGFARPVAWRMRSRCPPFCTS